MGMILKQDGLTFKQMALFLIVFLAMGFTGLIVAIIPPYLWSRSNYYTSGCTQLSSNTTCGGFLWGTNTSAIYTAQLYGLVPLNQEIVIRIMFENVANVAQDRTLQTAVTSYRSNDEGVTWNQIASEIHSRSYSCKSAHQACSSRIVFFYQGVVGFSDYKIEISFPDNHASAMTWIGDAEIQVNYVNASFNGREIGVRLFFFVAILIALILYRVKLRRYHFMELRLEQKWAHAVLIGGLFLCNPLYVLDIVVQGWFFPFLNNCFTIGFFCVCLLWWLIDLDSARVPEPENRKFVTFYLFKIVVVTGLGITGIVAWTIQVAYQLDDPSFILLWDYPGFLGIAIAYMIFLLAFDFYFWVLFIRSACHRRLTGSKYSCQHVWYISVLFGTLVIALDSLVMLAIFGPERYQGQELLLFFSFFSSYVLVNTFMTLPASNSTGTGFDMNDFQQFDEDEPQYPDTDPRLAQRDVPIRTIVIETGPRQQQQQQQVQEEEEANVAWETKPPTETAV